MPLTSPLSPCATVRRTMPESVGVRELRQNISRYLDRVKQGETLVVTEHGREVARLVPSSAAAVRACGRALRGHRSHWTVRGRRRGASRCRRCRPLPRRHRRRWILDASRGKTRPLTPMAGALPRHRAPSAASCWVRRTRRDRRGDRQVPSGQLSSRLLRTELRRLALRTTGSESVDSLLGRGCAGADRRADPGRCRDRSARGVRTLDAIHLATIVRLAERGWSTPS